ncbi:hypothetical protein [Agromyces aerolatus]|uniref:hypothetical protein n=1 Tax=Agromyces sp. LY-1074 TaxID=3074080 RepID=UPI0028608BF6|nr:MULTISPECIES: hypothetical protein [unclassified Agromyces]MDR5700964.1 hypothetical protein [Agromyces sp. LY-1074]MDR5707375.1 hypothetical protein [Agromyces sp. LY-1358]
MKRSEIAAARLKVALAKRNNETVSAKVAALAATPLVEAEVPAGSAAAALHREVIAQDGDELIVLQANPRPGRRSKAATVRNLKSSMNRTVRSAVTGRFVSLGPNVGVVVAPESPSHSTHR